MEVNLRRRSFQMKSSSTWMNSDPQALSTYSEKDDSGEAQERIMFEKQPIQRCIPGDEAKETDTRTVSLRDKKNILERLVKVPKEDNETFLLKIKNRLDRVGVQIPTIEVRFENLTVNTEAYVGSRALPTIPNFFINMLEGYHILPSNKRPFSILQNVSGIIKPSRMTLLLGPPSSGKTTLLLALAGKFDSDLQVSGRVTYNGHEMNEFIPQRASAYVSQRDNHIREMTVRETLAFSARCQGVGDCQDVLLELIRREKEANIKPDPDIDMYMKAVAMEDQESNLLTEYVLKILGLEDCKDTLLGDEMVRGVSGGQRKRVTTGEMLIGPARVLLMDDISTGLDSSTTFQIVKSLREVIHILNKTAVVSLLQPTPETYELFDDIIVLSEGHIVYQGPTEHVLNFFEFMGFKCPERRGIADFLQEVISRKDQQQYWACNNAPYRFVPVEDFAKAFESFQIGQKLRDELAIPFDKTKSHPAALTTKKYGVGLKQLFKACISREYLLMKRTSFVYFFKILNNIVMGFIVMTLFLRTEMDRNSVSDGGIFMGALYIVMVQIMFNEFLEISVTVMKLPILYKQRDSLFYPSWAYSLPTWILKIPLTFVEIAVWVFQTYYVIGFDSDLRRLFKQYLLLLCIAQMAAGMFRFIGALGRNMIVANIIGSYVLLAYMVMGGFVLSREDVKKWLAWSYWTSPLMYGQNAIAVNEFLGKSWRQVLPDSVEALGIRVLKSRGLFPEALLYLVGVGALIGYIFLLNFLFTLALCYLHPFGRPQPNLSEETLNTTYGDRTKENIELSSRAKRPADQNAAGGRENIIPNRNQRMGLPLEPLCITFDEIRYSVDIPKEMNIKGASKVQLELLKGVSGTFRPGVLTALMGVSGAGKTTLLDVLAGRKTGGYIEGSITISGYPKKQETFARVSGYCEQIDIHSPNITVYESLFYSALLRLPPEVNSASKKIFVEEVMEVVELTPLRDVLVGLPGLNGLSTEQRKRLTIAVELVANPSIIFMDEPTSGLDARAASIVMRTVRTTVDTGRTVVCTIHQPNIDIFGAFDELYLLKKGGEEIYVGPLGRNFSSLIKYFEGINGVRKMKDGHNPASWMLEITTASQEAALQINFTDVYKNSELYRRNKALIKELSTPSPGSKDLYFSRQYSQSLFTQCTSCLWKQHLSYWRNPSYNAARLIFTILIAFLFGTIFWDLGSHRRREQELFNAMGCLYATVMFLGTQDAGAVQPIVAVEQTVFYRERAAGMYSAFPYAFGQVMVEIPYIFVQVLIYSIIVYPMIGYEWTIIKFLWYIFFIYFALLHFTFFGMMVVAITPNPHVAAIVSSSTYTLWSIFSGFAIPQTRIPLWWTWLSKISPIAWSLNGLFTSQYGDVDSLLESGESVQDFMKRYFGFEHDFLGVVAFLVVVSPVVLAVIFAIALKVLNFQRR